MELEGEIVPYLYQRLIPIKVCQSWFHYVWGIVRRDFWERYFPILVVDTISFNSNPFLVFFDRIISSHLLGRILVKPDEFPILLRWIRVTAKKWAPMGWAAIFPSPYFLFFLSCMHQRLPQMKFNHRDITVKFRSTHMHHCSKQNCIIIL